MLAGCPSIKSASKKPAPKPAALSSSFAPYEVSAIPSGATTQIATPLPTLATASSHRTDDDFTAALYGSTYKSEFQKLGDPATLIDLAKTICDTLRTSGGDVQSVRLVLEESLTPAAGLLFVADTVSTYCTDQLPS